MTAPYYQDDAVTLYLGDFREVLPTIEVRPDAIVTDPPYGETTLGWDVWPTGWPSIAAEYARSSRRSRNIRIDPKHHSDNGSGLHADRFKRVHEHAVHWYRGDWASIHHETPTTNEATARAVRRKAKPVHHQGARGPSHFVSEDGGPRLTRSVIYARSMHGRAINETEKPVELVVPLVEYAAPPRGVVLDIFAGSGSTGVAARSTGRRAVLIELREEQCEKTARRLAAGDQGALDFAAVTA